MILAQLDGFVEIARRGSVSRAAEALFLTQPALTARLKGLERDLGTALFIRHGRGVRLTEAGRAFLPYAQRALDEIDEGRRLVAGVGRGGAGQLALGAAPAVSTYVLPAILERLQSAYPSVQLSVRTGSLGRGRSSWYSATRWRSGSFGRFATRTSRAFRSTRTSSFSSRILSTRSPLAGEVGVARIGDERLILFDRSSSYHDVTASFLRRTALGHAA